PEASILRQRFVEPARRPQEDPGEKTGRGGARPEGEETDRVAETAADLEIGEGHVAQRQRVDEGEEDHRGDASGEKAGPEDRPEPLRQRPGRVVEHGLFANVAHGAPDDTACSLPWDSDQT